MHTLPGDQQQVQHAAMPPPQPQGPQDLNSTTFNAIYGTGAVAPGTIPAVPNMINGQFQGEAAGGPGAVDEMSQITPDAEADSAMLYSIAAASAAAASAAAARRNTRSNNNNNNGGPPPQGPQPGNLKDPNTN